MTYLWPAILPPFSIGAYNIEHDFGIEFAEMESGDTRGRTFYDNQPMTVSGDQVLTHYEYAVLMSFLAKAGAAEFEIPLVLPTQLDTVRRDYSARVISKASSGDLTRSYRTVSLTLFIANPEIVDFDDIVLQATLGEAWPSIIICLDEVANQFAPTNLGGEPMIEAYFTDWRARMDDLSAIALTNLPSNL